MKKRMILTLLFIFLAMPGFSQTVYEPTDEHAVISMDEVVVTATRQEEKIFTVPANVTVINEKDIKNSTAFDVPELLRSQVGVYVNDIAGNRRNYTVDLRGFGETAGLNTLVLVDGRRINQADLSGTDWTLIPLDRIKRIEIIRGGRGSTLYGDNATGGVVNIITKEGEKFQAGAEVKGGSYDTFKGSVNVSGTLEDLSYSISGSYLESDGYRDNSDTEAKDIGGHLNYFVSERISLNFSAGYHDDDTGLPGAIKASDFAAGASRTDTLHPDDYADVEDYYFKFEPEIFFLKDSIFKIDASYRKRNFLSFASFDAGSFTGDTEIDTVSISPQIIFREKILGLNNRLILGFDYTNVEEDITNESIFFGFPSKGVFTLEKENYGFYIHNEIQPLDSLAISAGYRYDRAKFDFDPIQPGDSNHKTVDEDLFTSGVTYTFLGTSSIYFSYSRSFRYPVMDELFSFFTNNIDPDLKLQASDNYELGVRHYFTKSLYANLNVFRIDTDDEIVFNPITFENQNLDGETRRDGFELSLTKTLPWATLSANYTYMDATIENGTFEGSDFPNVPEHKFALNTLFSLPYSLSLAIDGVYVGERPFISDFSNAFEDQEDYLVINTKLMYNWKQMTAFLIINNITDEKYSEYGGISTFPIDEPGFFPSPEINFLVGVSSNF
jgi:iron complex outermembrane receptor protein